MADFVQYKTSNTLGNMLAKSIDYISQANGYLSQFNSRFERMDEDLATRYLVISDYDAFVKAVKTITEALEDGKLIDAMLALDQ